MHFLQTLWFLLICVLWTGYLVLEGFDFGVGMLIRTVAKSDAEKRSVIHSIGPVWDGNEVWLLVAGGATFAAFPEWYATLFSGFYLALFLILAALIVRGVAFEFWGKETHPGWRGSWEWSLIVGSAVPALLWGVAWANIVRGVPLDLRGEFDGTLLTLLNPYALLGGVASLLLFLGHGASFLVLRTTGEVRERSERVAGLVRPAAAVAVAAFAIWTIARQASGNGVEIVSAVLVVAAAGLAAASAWRAVRPGVAFGLTAGTIVALFAGLWVELFPDAIVSSGPGPSLALSAASSSNYTLKVMTVVAVVFVPIVLAYQAWTYWVFRARLGAEDFADVRSPVDVLARTRLGEPQSESPDGHIPPDSAPAA
jgi:cytochrome d ubiquinol oxidase subunit II